MKSFFLYFSFLIILAALPLHAQNQVIDQWTYIQVDASRKNIGSLSTTWSRAFGLAFGDVNGDGFQDIASGRYVHINPGGDMTGAWQRIDFNIDLDALLFVNVDDDAYPDIIAVEYPSIFWLEALNTEGTSWSATHIAYLEPTAHQNSQGYMLGQLVAGGKPEIILASGNGIHYLAIPDDPRGGLWPSIHIVSDPATMDEGIGVCDVDSDGDIDVVIGKEFGENSFAIDWHENPGDASGDWPRYRLSTDTNTPDRIVCADFNGDDAVDVAVSEERWPGKEPNAALYWFENPKSAHKTWKRHWLMTTWSMNNLDAGDIDNDGDIDLVTNEHKGSEHPIYIFQNDGKGSFEKHVIDKGKEMHLGARLYDLDSDGDLDIAGTGWDQFRFMHVWRNDTVNKNQN
jgi:FG-GAP-like repeat